MNILFAFADDWGRYARAYAEHEGEASLNHIISTPSFDRVAREGALFLNAFVPAPSCTPCRSSVLSGRYFWQTGLGAILLGAVWDESIPSYPLELEKAGYFIGHTAKVWSPGKANNAPYGGARTAYDKAGWHFGSFSQNVTKRAPAIGVEAAKGEMYAEVRGNFGDFLKARPKGQPFCYWWGPTNTHRLWERGSGKALWGLEPDDFKGRMPAFLPDVHEVREDFADYMGECMAFDAGLGVLLDRLEEEGELDDTLIVVSGDHGIPGMPRGKCNLYDIGCEVALAARLPGTIKPGTVIEDLVNIMDLAPTFMEATGNAVTEGMAAKSLMPLLTSGGRGQIDPGRDHVVVGRERHVHDARDGFLPYPQRAIRTREYLFIINFEPDRWPMGDPKGMDDPEAEPIGFEALELDTMVAYSDLDASPTKAWMVHHRNEAGVRPLFELGFGKRPREELYDLRADADHMENLAGKAGYGEVADGLRNRLMAILREQNDPRVTESPCRFEEQPYAGPLQPFQR
ncbi:MAG: sulfatase [Oscillospiraceae bacterium]|nr:sulfatase [Oscillospiraceae bacterium]